jgi:hypothetical protein
VTGKKDHQGLTAGALQPESLDEDITLVLIKGTKGFFPKKLLFIHF